jgi:HprK-related kinase B
MKTPLCCSDLIHQVRRDFPAAAVVHLAFGQCRLAVSVNREDMARELMSYFREFKAGKGPVDIEISAHDAPETELPVAFTAKPPDPGKTRVKEEYADLPDGRIVRKRLTGMVFVFNGRDNMAMGPCMENMNQVVNFINNRYIEWLLCAGCILGHASGVVINGRGLALAGFSGAGKSTLALELMNRDAVFVSNDRLMVEPNGENVIMHGVAKLPRINPGTVLNNPALRKIMTAEDLQRFSAMEEEALWNLEHKYDAPIDMCYGPDRFVLDADMAALVLLNWQRIDHPLCIQQVDLSQRRDLLPAFMKSVGLFFLPGETCRMPDPAEETYINLLSRCRVWELSGGIDFNKAAKACLKICT